MKNKKVTHVMVTAAELLAAGDSLFNKEDEKAVPKVSATSQYRKLALSHYRRAVSGTDMNVCVVCGFGIQSILEVAHLDQNRKNNSLENLAVLCPNCHKMHDVGLIPSGVIIQLRDSPQQENWLLRIKDAGVKAAATKRDKVIKAAKSAAGKKAWATRGKKSDSGGS